MLGEKSTILHQKKKFSLFTCFPPKKNKGTDMGTNKLSDIAYIVRNCGAKWCPSSRPKLSFVKGAVSTQIV